MSKFGLSPKTSQSPLPHPKSTSDSGVSSNSASGNLGGHARSNSQIPNATKTVQFQIAGQPKPASGQQAHSSSSLELSLTDFLGTLSKEDLMPSTGSGSDRRTTSDAGGKSPRAESPQGEKIRTFFAQAKQKDGARIDSQSSPSLDTINTTLTSSTMPTTDQTACAPRQGADPAIRQDTEWDDLAPDVQDNKHRSDAQRQATASPSNITEALVESIEGLRSIGRKRPTEGVTVPSTAVGTGPHIEPVFEWAADPQALLSAAGFTSSTLVLERSTELLNLLRALEENDMAQVQSALALIPPEVEHHDRYFPVAPFIDGYDDFARTAALYAQKGTAPSWQRLQQFMEACDRRVQGFNQVLADHTTLTEAQLDLRYTPEVKALCVALRLTHELEISAQSQKLSVFIRRAVVTHGEALPGLLAQQPFVGLRMALIKCTVLAAHMDAQLIASFRARVLQAIDMQRNASESLRKLLLTDTLDETKIASLALVEYAKQATSVPLDYVSTGATWEDVSKMIESLDLVFTYYVEQGDAFDVEQAALHGVLARMRHSLLEQQL